MKIVISNYNFHLKLLFVQLFQIGKEFQLLELFSSQKKRIVSRKRKKQKKIKIKL